MKNKTMKYFLILGVLAAIVLGGMYALNGKGITVDQTEKIQQEPIEKIKEVNPLDEKYVQREKELDEIYSSIQSTQARIDVNQAEIDRLTLLIKEDRAKLADFMTAIE